MPDSVVVSLALPASPGGWLVLEDSEAWVDSVASAEVNLDLTR